MSVRVGRFELDGRVASGGSAEVYRARDPLTGRDVALKRLRIDRDDATGWFSDCIHPNDRGHHELRRLFFEAIDGTYRVTP